MLLSSFWRDADIVVGNGIIASLSLGLFILSGGLITSGTSTEPLHVGTGSAGLTGLWVPLQHP